ncbi:MULTISPECIES: SCO family protein [Oceanobacillus]|uniref:SCO family protein n=1 Tax=Oceanobacillus TaxID=182709 RepID=UPI0005963C06|nr:MULTISPECIES: SCO family protein [Oceanobacillus]
MKRSLFLLLILTFLLAACGKEIETNMDEEVENFEFITQDNQTLSLEDLKGSWWVADFIFTNCTTVCLPMTSNMAELQRKMKEEDINASLVSFTVDPDIDTPEVLKAYASSYGADFSNWTFLTGYAPETIKGFSVNSFRSIVEPPPEDSNQVTHGTSFYLIDPEGKIIKRYSGVDSQSIEEIIDDLKIVN